jgi:uncharacterized linocin/CFP29 family protein
MDFLKRNLAPITSAAWSEIEEQARQILKSSLTARRIVDVEGPRGLHYAAVSSGHLDIPKGQKKGAIEYGVYRVQPLVEIRHAFELGIWELDNIERGARDIDLGPLEQAARDVALFEEKALYQGFGPGGIKGLLAAATNAPVAVAKDGGNLLHAVAAGVQTLKDQGIDGPYSLAINPDLWTAAIGESRGYPLQKQLAQFVDGTITTTPQVKDALLVSNRGGDLVMTLGLDISIGFLAVSGLNVKLFFTESFTFEVIDPSVIVPLKRS